MTVGQCNVVHYCVGQRLKITPNPSKEKRKEVKVCLREGLPPSFLILTFRQKVALGKRMISAYRSDDRNRTRDHPFGGGIEVHRSKNFHKKVKHYFFYTTRWSKPPVGTKTKVV